MNYRVTDFRVVLARDWNRGRPDGKEAWVVFDNTEPTERGGPVVCQTLDQVCKAIKMWGTEP